MPQKPSISDALRVRSLTKQFGATLALDDVSFNLRSGAVHALVGGNGSGKSTIIKLLAGVHSADPGGHIDVHGKSISADQITPGWSRDAGLRFVHQDLGLFENLSVAENLSAGFKFPGRPGFIDWRALYRAAQNDLDRLDLPINAQATLGSLGPADQTLVAIARALRGFNPGDPVVLVLDEPTTRLPAAEVDTLLERIRGYASQGSTVIYVSHRLEEVLSVADNVVALRDGRVVADTPAEGVTEADLVSFIVGKVSSEPASARPVRSLQNQSARVSIKGLRGGPIDGLDLEVAAGEIVGLAGLGGSGRSSLLRMVYGQHRPSAGSITVDGVDAPARIDRSVQLGVRYVPEDRIAEGIFSDLSIAANLVSGRIKSIFKAGFYRYRLEHRQSLDDIAEYGVKAASPSALISSLSGGNQQKVVMSRAFHGSPRLVLLDEPTQGVDIGARREIYNIIRRAVDLGTSVLIASSDNDELLTLCDRIVVLAHGQIVGQALTNEIDRHWLGDRVYGGVVHDVTD